MTFRELVDQWCADCQFVTCRLGGCGFVFALTVFIFQTCEPVQADEEDKQAAFQLSAAMIAVSDVSTARLTELRSAGTDTIVLPLATADTREKDSIRKAISKVQEAGLAFGFWIEVARSPELADKRPDWMASLQTHDQWRRFYPDTPQPKANEVVKTYPWVPILSREPFVAQRERVTSMLADLPEANVVFLNDLQGAPSACGCGNPLCRWTSDYGDQRTTVPLGDDAAALFVSAIEKATPNSEVIPVWTTECEEHDGHPDGLCAGVGCFKGICWKAYTRQLMPLAETCDQIAVLATYKLFQRDLKRYGEAEASWVSVAIETFATMPPRHHGKSIPASRIIAVVQGWNVTAAEIESQQAAARKAGAQGCLVALEKIEQSWTPKVVAWK